MKRALAIVIFVAACGGKSTNKPAEPMPGHDEHGEMAGMPPELGKFHDLLAPRYHAEKGPKRMADTCGAMADFKAAADALNKATPPAKANVAAWQQENKELAEALTGMETVCKGTDQAAFDQAFEHMHHEFEEIVEAGQGKAEGPEGKEEKGGY